MSINSSSRSFYDIVSKMPKRNDLKKQIKIINTKTYSRALPWSQRIVYEFFNHKKKIIFFSILACIMYQYGYFGKTLRWLKNIQPFRNKIDRWVLGRRNKLEGNTIKEQDLEEIKLSQTSKQKLLEYYLLLDKQLQFGVGRGSLFNIFNSYGLMWSEQRIQEYWKQSGYMRERNQRVAGATAKQFLQLIAFSIGKLKQFNPNLTQDDLVSDFLGKLRGQVIKIRQQQSNLQKDRQREYMKIVKQDEFKEQYLNQLISSNSKFDPEQTDRVLKQNGLKGLSVKDHHQLVTNKIVEVTLRKHLINKKMESIYKQHKLPKYRKQYQEVQKELSKLEETQKRLEEEYKHYYGCDIY